MQIIVSVPVAKYVYGEWLSQYVFEQSLCMQYSNKKWPSKPSKSLVYTTPAIKVVIVPSHSFCHKISIFFPARFIPSSLWWTDGYCLAKRPWKQDDKIWRNFAHWAPVYFGQVSEN
jgi:hypothetical protein